MTVKVNGVYDSSVSTLYMMSLPENILQLMQMIGRIHCFGQTEEQRIWVVTLNDSYNNWLQANGAAKFAAQLSGEADMRSTELSDNQKTKLMEEVKAFTDDEVELFLEQHSNDQIFLVADGLTRQLLGQRCSRLLWRAYPLECKPPSTVDTVG
jgi:lysyl-tRNA synthetase class I